MNKWKKWSTANSVLALAVALIPQLGAAADVDQLVGKAGLNKAAFDEKVKATVENVNALARTSKEGNARIIDLLRTKALAGAPTLKHFSQFGSPGNPLKVGEAGLVRKEDLPAADLERIV